MTDKTGIFITLEGIEGAGKSTVLPFLTEQIETLGYTVERSREPGGGPLGEALRAIFLNPDLQLDVEEELLLLYAGRHNHLRSRILPALAAGKVLLCDRYEDSTIAYQGGGRGVPLARIAELSHWAGISRQPDLTFWLDIDPQLAAERIRDRRPDRMELESIDFFRRARAAFAERAASDPKRFCHIDASQPLLQVQEQLRAALLTRVPTHRSGNG
ncbi:dTMP kinase [Acidithiobacillus sp. IBUN Pt1247-S3]|uniref:dTMP kinase n=1 Tax=Acidithiobacillus sp. IBUN Pt1247-S3 TaxID=3166642 RepID=UPI0034E47814